ncbi:MAG: RluA family pseudouridine synthase [Ruminococcaceae bacterium]|nr:RluA family pseudouridine synthase [Oscillospiraceae bacterium]
MQYFKEIYNDENLLVVSKSQGIPTEPDAKDSTCLIELVQSEYGNSCRLCHRLDRNTGGLVLIAKNPGTEKLITDAIKEKRIKKTYRFYVDGMLQSKAPKGKMQRIDAYHFKDAKQSRVYIYDTNRKFCKPISTRYKTIEYDSQKNITLIEAELITGRTHQIRAQFSHLGHPVIGDGKYGSNKTNRKFKYKFQTLWSYKIDLCGILKEYGVPDVFTSKPEFM